MIHPLGVIHPEVVVGQAVNVSVLPDRQVKRPAKHASVLKVGPARSQSARTV